ncbi:MAG: Flp pilus assembly complex ATPase component TadA, partial [Candidatus Methanomethylophilaceae archaeon]|nr:Flp pilus assembly complex ATPase component TadA [Candidatus Methanomethylophilaceae archaeon]
MKQMIPPWRRKMITGKKREMITGDPFCWDFDPFDDLMPSFDRTEHVPHDVLASRNDFTSAFSLIVGKDIRTKPSYTDCWLMKQPENSRILSKYRTRFASVTVRLSDDGQTEYSVVPVEYSFSDRVNAIITDVIRDIRTEYRLKGGRLDRDSVMGLARSFLTDRFDDLKEVCSKEADIDLLIDDICSAAYRNSVGAGIFEPLLTDPHIEDVYLDAPCDENRVHVTVNGIDGINSHIRCRTNLMVDRREMDNLINILKRESGLRFCQSSPVLETDFREYDARATVVGYPMSPNGDALAIRKHSVRPWTLTRLLANGTVDPRSAGLLSFLVNNRSTFLVCGARGAGKSSL